MRKISCLLLICGLVLVSGVTRAMPSYSNLVVFGDSLNGMYN